MGDSIRIFSTRSMSFIKNYRSTLLSKRLRNIFSVSPKKKAMNTFT